MSEEPKSMLFRNENEKSPVRGSPLGHQTVVNTTLGSDGTIAVIVAENESFETVKKHHREIFVEMLAIREVINEPRKKKDNGVDAQ